MLKNLRGKYWLIPLCSMFMIAYALVGAYVYHHWPARVVDSEAVRITIGIVGIGYLVMIFALVFSIFDS